MSRPSTSSPADQSPADLEFVRGEGTLLFDADGNDYLHACGNAATIGHSHPRVVDAVSTQAALLFTHTGYLNRVVLDCSDALVDTFPASLDRAVFTSGSSAANDLALRMARAATTAKGIIVTRNARHGVTTETAAISPSLVGLAGLAGWVRVVGAPTGDGSTFVEAVAAAAVELRDSEYGFAGLIVDPAFSSDGAISPSLLSRADGGPAESFLASAADAVRAAGGLVIADEARSGFGRLGDGMWGFEHHGFVPDIVSLGEQVANGMPGGCVVTTTTIADAFAPKGLDSVAFGDSLVSLAAARAVLDTIRDENLAPNIKSVGDYLRFGIALLASAHPSVGEIRGSGLNLGIEIVGADSTPDETRASAIVAELLRRHILVGTTGLAHNVMEIAPPLTFGIPEADRLLEQLHGALLATATPT